jgi:hypothetical protein
VKRKQKRGAEADVGLDMPPELRDPDHQVWHDQRRYHQYMGQRRWRMPPQERMGVAVSPDNRRRAAAAAWARQTGVATRTYGPPNSRRVSEVGPPQQRQAASK